MSEPPINNGSQYQVYAYDSKVGYVYIVHPIGVNAYKIGCTVNLFQRYRKLQSAKDYQLEFVACVLSNDPYRLEYLLHRRFVRCHLSGEWFALTPEDVKYIKGPASP